MSSLTALSDAPSTCVAGEGEGRAGRMILGPELGQDRAAVGSVVLHTTEVTSGAEAAVDKCIHDGQSLCAATAYVPGSAVIRTEVLVSKQVPGR